MRGIEPDIAPAAAEADDRELPRVPAMRLRPGGSAVEIAHDVGVRGFRHHLAHDLGRARQLGEIGEAPVELGRDGEIAELGEAAADILDVVVDAENLLDDQDDREGAGAIGLGVVRRHLVRADGDPHFTRVEAHGVGIDHLRLDARGGKRQAGDQSACKRAAAARPDARPSPARGKGPGAQLPPMARRKFSSILARNASVLSHG